MVTITNKECSDNLQEISEQLRAKVRSLLIQCFNYLLYYFLVTLFSKVFQLSAKFV